MNICEHQIIRNINEFISQFKIRSAGLISISGLKSMISFVSSWACARFWMRITITFTATDWEKVEMLLHKSYRNLRSSVLTGNYLHFVHFSVRREIEGDVSFGNRNKVLDCFLRVELTFKMIVSEKFTKSISDAGPTVILNLRDFTLYPIRSVIPNPASLRLRPIPKYRQYQPSISHN